MKRHVDLVGVLFIIWGLLTALVGVSTLALAIGAFSLIESSAGGGHQMAAGVTAAALLLLGTVPLVWGGRASFPMELTTPACPVKDQMRDQARAGVMRLPGVAAVDVRMDARVREAASPDAARAAITGVKNVIAVGAGKGGVGKTTVA